MAARQDDPDLLVRLLDQAPALVILVDAETRVRWVNQPAAELFGYSVEDALGRSVVEFLDPDWDPEAFESIATAIGATGMRQPMLFRVPRPDGTKVIVEVTANARFDDPVLDGMVVYARRWDERYLLDQALEAMAASRPLDETLELLVRIAEAETLAADAAFLHDRTGPCFAGQVASPDLAPPLAGPTPDQPASVAAAWAALVPADDGVVHDVDDLPPLLAGPARAAGYRTLWVWPAGGTVGQPPPVVAVAWRREPHVDRDQTRRQAMARLARIASLVVERVRSEEATAHAAAHDALTGLANRARFYEVLERALADSADGVGVVYLDLDGFKPINDVLGHGVGDGVLAEVGRRIAAAAPEGALAARLGGDEFALVCPADDLEQLVAWGRKLVDAVDRPVDVGGPSPVRVAASVGVALGGTRRDADALVEAADAALYEAKRAGGGAVRVGRITDTPA